MLRRLRLAESLHLSHLFDGSRCNWVPPDILLYGVTAVFVCAILCLFVLLCTRSLQSVPPLCFLPVRARSIELSCNIACCPLCVVRVLMGVYRTTLARARHSPTRPSFRPSVDML